MNEIIEFLKRLQSGLPQRALFVGIVLSMFAVLGTMIYKREQILASPTRVLLECEPVDPRSILSGDYVILNYRISRFEGEEIAKLNVFEEDVPAGAYVYVALRKQSSPSKPALKLEAVDSAGEALPQLHTAVAFSQDPDRLRADARFADAILIRGKVVYSSGLFRSQDNTQLPAPPEGQYRYLELEYGLESYFVPQHEGRSIERDLARATVLVAVTPAGQSAVRDLFLDGEKVRFY